MSSFDQILKMRLERLLEEVEDLSVKLDEATDEDIDPVVVLRCLVALEGVRSHLVATLERWAE